MERSMVIRTLVAICVFESVYAVVVVVAMLAR